VIKRTDTSLLEQLQISDVEIAHRMALLGLEEQHFKLMASYKMHIEEHIDAIVDEFYQKQTEIDEITLLIGDSETLMRLRNAQRKYILDLFSGIYDSDYVNNRLRIGMVHKRIGVEPKLYLSAIKSLKQLIIISLAKSITDKLELQNLSEAIDTLFYFDTTLVFDTYISCLIGEIESEKRKTEIYAKSLEAKVAERTRQLEELAKLDPLTGLYNQRAMHEVLKRELSLAKRRENSVSLAYFDVDKFKQINDSQGHVKGDEILKFVGQVLRTVIREVDLPCRYGGDEFCVIFPDCELESAFGSCQRIVERFAERYPEYSLSIGLAVADAETIIEAEALIKLADDKMYQAKAEDGSKICR
jgi:diguanylate cyclase (GGDEF)-like protein